MQSTRRRARVRPQSRPATSPVETEPSSSRRTPTEKQHKKRRVGRRRRLDSLWSPFCGKGKAVYGDSPGAVGGSLSPRGHTHHYADLERERCTGYLGGAPAEVSKQNPDITRSTLYVAVETIQQADSLCEWGFCGTDRGSRASRTARGQL